MKRIKTEEIQETIKNYLKQRNVSTTPRSSVSQRALSTTAAAAAVVPPILDYNQIASNDIALLESSINDYYAYCLSSPSFEADYLKEFDALKNFLEKSDIGHESDALRQLLNPILVYMCVDLIGLGVSIRDQVIRLFDKVVDVEIKSLVDDLLLLEKGQEKSKKLNDIIENKWRIYLNAVEWRRFLNFLINCKCYLLLRIVNLNLQIVRLDQKEPIELPTLITETKSVKLSQPQESEMNSKRPTSRNSENSVSLKSLRDCIHMIRCKPPTINGACCFYVNDTEQKITSSTLAEDNKLAAFTTDDSSIYLYDLTGESTADSRQHLTGGHANTVLKARFTHDAAHLVSCDFDGLVCVWTVNGDSRRANLAASYSGHLYPVWDVEPFSTLNLFATCSKDDTARLWSFDRVYPLRVYAGHQADVNCVRFHPNASYLATGSSDKTVRLWSVHSCEFVRLFSGHRSRVFALAFSPDGNYLASAGEDKKVIIFSNITFIYE